MKRSTFLKGAAALALAPFMPVRLARAARTPTVLPPASYDAVADGIVDWGPWIQAQIDRGYCYLPPGVYPVRTPITLRSGASLIGSGDSEIVSSSDPILNVPSDVRGAYVSRMAFRYDGDGEGTAVRDSL